MWSDDETWLQLLTDTDGALERQQKKVKQSKKFQSADELDDPGTDRITVLGWKIAMHKSNGNKAVDVVKGQLLEELGCSQIERDKNNSFQLGGSSLSSGLVAGQATIVSSDGSWSCPE